MEDMSWPPQAHRACPQAGSGGPSWTENGHVGRLAAGVDRISKNGITKEEVIKSSLLH